MHRKMPLVNAGPRAKVDRKNAEPTHPYCLVILVITNYHRSVRRKIFYILSYCIRHDASPIVILQLTLSIELAFSKDRIVSMMRDTPEGQGKVR